MVVRQLGPMMIQQMQQRCDQCQGEGEIINPKDRCSDCKGRKLVEKGELLEINVEKGMTNGQKITLHGKANDGVGLQAGDVIFVVQEQEHERFVRKADDLFLEHTLTLSEALCGFRFKIVHMDGRELIVSSRPGEIIKPGDIKGIPNEGMPRHRNHFLKGNLFISFKLQFPMDGSIAPDAQKALEQLLPAKPPPPTFGEEAEEVFLTVDKRQAQSGNGGGHGGSREAYDEDEAGHPGGVKCQSQ